MNDTLPVGAAADGRPLRPAVFIDKDGTLIENVPYNADPALLRFMPAAFESLAALAGAGFALLVVTNQSGLALGYFTRLQFARLQAELQRRLREEAGVDLLDFVLCPHAPGPDGGPACLCRKPAPGMLLRAARMHGLDLARSWMVGDTLDDVEAGHRAGCRSLLFDSGGETVWRRSPLRVPEARCTGWGDVVQTLLAGGTGGGTGASTGACVKTSTSDGMKTSTGSTVGDGTDTGSGISPDAHPAAAAHTAAGSAEAVPAYAS